VDARVKNISFRKDRNRWGFRKEIKGQRYSRFLWQSKEEATTALAEFEAEVRAKIARVKNREDLSELMKLCGATFEVFQFEKMIRPCVYAILRQGEVIYVGMSKQGIARPFDIKHHVRRHFRLSDEVVIFWRGSVADAGRVERELINYFAPRLNIQGLEFRSKWLKGANGQFLGSQRTWERNP